MWMRVVKRVRSSGMWPAFFNFARLERERGGNKGLSRYNCYNFAQKSERESERYLLHLFLDEP